MRLGNLGICTFGQPLHSFQTGGVSLDLPRGPGL